MKRAIFALTALFIVLFAAHAQERTAEDFEAFLNKFTTSASFQYERIKFPLTSGIVLMNDEFEEKEYAFTREKWPLLDKETFRTERITQEEGGVYVSHFVYNEADRKDFEAGYEESEIDLRVVFELIEGQWFVIDCYTSWYTFDLSPEELQETIDAVTELNEEFKQLNP